jgi:uncharacterized protein (TIGR03083 family)
MTGIPPIDVNDVLVTERRAFLGLLHGLEAAEWDAPTECPAWTVKGVALHVLGDDLSLLSRQRDAAMPGTLLFAEAHPGATFRQLLDGFNEQWVTAAEFLSPSLVIELLRLTGEWTSTFYKEVDPESLNEPVGFFAAKGPSPYWQIAAREYVERWAHHHQIRRALGRHDLGDEFLLPGAATVMRGLAAHMPDLGAAEGSSVVFTIADLNSWTLTRTQGGWSLADAGVTDATAELTLTLAEATPVLTRAYRGSEARAAFATSGDQVLAGRALDVVAVMAGRP